MYKCLAYTPYQIEHHESSEYVPGQWVCTCFVIGFTQISILKLIKTGWFQTSTQNRLHAILYWVNERNEQVRSEK